MSTPKTFEAGTFQPERKRYLVEASAGTGKTYSIAIMVLKLILEKGVSIDRILMVTFTNAAVAELELRIRKFVRSGLKYARDDTRTDREIEAVIDAAGNETAALKLAEAVQMLDQLSVFTIHAFCQRTISEFTFETRQSFDFELLKDDSPLFKQQVYSYFREHLNTIENGELFKKIWESIDLEALPGLLRKLMQGMELTGSEGLAEQTEEETGKAYLDAEASLKEVVRSNRNSILGVTGSNALKNAIQEDDEEKFIRLFRTNVVKEKKDEPNKYFAHFDFMKGAFEEAEEAIVAASDRLLKFHYIRMAETASENIGETKGRKGFIAFDDQIRTVHEALRNDTFIAGLKEKYDAAFIDEFQDTDRMQYGIFKGVFGENRTLFFIGDPKQSIYGWRKADLETYNDAREDVGEEVYSMQYNYRSTAKLVEALNILFKPADGYNVFKDDKIRYEKVEAGNPGLGSMTENGREVVPVTVMEFGTNDNRTNDAWVAREVYRLLTGDARINEERIRPSDIGILVREGKEGDRIKAALARYNIPSVKRDDLRVMKSDEAIQLQYLLKAVLDPTSGGIRRAMYSQHFGYDLDRINALDEEKNVEIFLGLKKRLVDEGIYNMISEFLDIYGIRQLCMKDVLGQRVLTNLIHLAELLHTAEKTFRYTPEELLTWMQRAKESDEDEYEQRIESDENAVQISTIHKSKGLTYKIVFAPYLSMIPKFRTLEKGKVNDFRKKGKYLVTLDYPGLDDEDRALFDDQKEQENRRLIYVALTRAVYKCYISLVPREYGTQKEAIDSSLLRVLRHHSKGSDPDLIGYEEQPQAAFRPDAGTYDPSEEEPAFEPRKTEVRKIHNAFGIHSFSALSRAHHISPFEAANLSGESAYDHFIFQELPRGANAGNALHSIFEFLDFNDENSWEQSLKDASGYYSNLIKENKLGHFKKMVSHVMKTRIPLGTEPFRLQEIRNEKKIPEMEFYFSVDRINRSVLNDYLGEEATVGGESDLSGLMTGFIDLVFEQDGKYYILDWKSNYLGNAVEDYSKSKLEEAMKGSNYHLQYMIYTVALTRWLKIRIPDFDYEKHFGGVIYVFLRGVRENRETGIFTAFPDEKVIAKLDQALSANESQTTSTQ
ncbi:MAG: UvrD-helicase domain-containing protein [Bacteroidales bacterium]|nr:UvrD-helicase domain-containing protein [Bacteroidales bacterium]